MSQTCELCKLREADFEVGEYGFCDDCQDEYSRLIRGIQYELGSFPDRYQEGEQVHWYTYAGLRKTLDIRRSKPSHDIVEYKKEFQKTTANLGVKRTLTHLLLHHHIGTVAHGDTDYSDGEAGLPPRMIQYGINLAASVYPVPGSKGVIPDDKEIISEVSTASPAEFSESYLSPEFYMSQQLFHQLEAIYAKSISDEADLDPISGDYEALKSAQMLDLDAGELAYPETYLEAMERWYTPFQYEFLQEKGIDMVKSVSWARDLLELFHERILNVLQEIRLYQADALELIGDAAVPVYSGEDETFEDAVSREELHRANQLSWTVLLVLAERNLWISRGELVARIAPNNQSKFCAFLDRISEDAGQFSTTNPGGFLETEKHPLVRIENQYLIPDTQAFTRSLANTFFHDLKNFDVSRKLGDQTYDLGNIRGEIAEEWVRDYLVRIFGDRHTHTNIEPDQSDHEIDLLVVSGDAAIVAEVKSKPLTKEALSGDLEKIHEDIKAGIDAAASQLQKRIECLEAGEFREEVPELGQVSEYLPMIVVPTGYGSFATTAYPALLTTNFKPYVVSVYDLDVISRILSADEFVEYLQDRIIQNRAGQLRSMDETDYLGMFLSGPWIGSSGFLSSQFEEAEDLPGIEVLAPIAGADQTVHEHLPEFSLLVRLEFLTPRERQRLW